MAVPVNISISTDNGITFTDYTSDVLNKNRLSLSYSLGDSTRVSDQSLSSDFIFKGAAFTLLEEQFFSDGQCKNSVVLKVDIDCCDIPPLEYYINSLSVSDYCPTECTIQAALIRKNNSFDANNKLINTDSSLIDSITVVNFEFLEVFFAGSSIQVGGNTVGGFSEIKQRKMNLVWEFLDYHARQSGLVDGLQSSILRGQDYDRMIFWPPTDSNVSEADNYGPIDLLNDLEPVFNAQWRITNTAIVFEPVNYFYQNPSVVYNLRDLRTVEPVCFKYIKGESYKGIDFRYIQNAGDSLAKEAEWPRYYGGRIEYTTFDEQIAKGYRNVNLNVGIPFSMTALNIPQVPLFSALWASEFNVTTENLKLFIWDGNNPGRIVTNGTNFTDNFPLRFNIPDLQLFSGIQGRDLNSRFYAFEENQKCPARSSKDIDVLWNCDLLRDVETFGVDVGFYDPSFGVGFPKDIGLDFSTKTITLSELTFRYY